MGENPASQLFKRYKDLVEADKETIFYEIYLRHKPKLIKLGLLEDFSRLVGELMSKREVPRQAFLDPQFVAELNQVQEGTHTLVQRAFEKFDEEELAKISENFPLAE